MAGIPGSGKSTWCRHYALTHPHTHIVDSDEVRKKLMGSYRLFPTHMETIFDAMIAETNTIFAQEKGDCTVIEDSIFLDDYRRVYFMKRIHGQDHSLLFMVKYHDYAICFRQNKMRTSEKWVPEETIKAMISTYKDPSQQVTQLFDEVKVEWWDKGVIDPLTGQ